MYTKHIIKNTTKTYKKTILPELFQSKVVAVVVVVAVDLYSASRGASIALLVPIAWRIQMSFAEPI